MSDDTAVAVAIDFFYQAWNHGLSKLPINRDDLTAGIVRFPNDDDVTSSHTPAGRSRDPDRRLGRRPAVPGGRQGRQAVGRRNGQPVMQKGFYIFKNSWGRTSSA